MPETLTRGERAAWFVQSMFRRWTVFIVLQLITFLWLWLGNRDWWNWTWSALAVDVEFITALALVSLARRDHETINRIENLEKNILALMEHHGVEIPDA